MKGTLSQRTAEKVDEVVVRSNFSDLTPETLLEAFKAEGIASLDDLAKQLTAALRDPKGRPQPIPFSELFSKPTPRAVREAIVHHVPKVPFVVDGVMHDPEDISRYNGEELCFIPQNGGTEMLVLREKGVWAPFLRNALLSRAVAAGLSAAEGYQYGGYTWVSPQDTPPLPPLGDPQPGPFGERVPEPPPEALSLYTDIDLGGSSLTLHSGESYRDLTHVGWWIFAGDYNDEFSSLHRTSSLCLAFEHVGFQGSPLWAGPRYSHTFNLHTEGWGDRISSVINGG